MSKKNEQKMNQEEEIADAKGGAMVVATGTEVSTNVAVSGVQLDFPFLRLGQGMSQWRTNGRQPLQGAWYISKAKDNNVFVADSGRDAGVRAILLEKVEGIKEVRKYEPGVFVAPKRWTAYGTKEDGTPRTIEDCRVEAANEGFRPFSAAARDAGMKIYDPFCYLMMLIQLPDDFESDDFRLFPIGGHLYTTARYEFDKQYYKELSTILGNLRSRAMWKHERAGDKDFKWTECGLLTHLYSVERKGKTGISYPAPAFEKFMEGGKPAEMTAAEKSDFTAFLMAAKASAASLDESASDEFAD